MTESPHTYTDTLVPNGEDARLLNEWVKLLSIPPTTDTTYRLCIESETGAGAVPVPQAALQMLRQILGHMARGNIVKLVPFRPELTMRQAADLLNVSRPYVIQLVESGELPVHEVGGYERILYADLMEYKRKGHEIRQKVLDELAREAQELGLGYQ